MMEPVFKGRARFNRNILNLKVKDRFFTILELRNLFGFFGFENVFNALTSHMPGLDRRTFYTNTSRQGPRYGRRWLTANDDVILELMIENSLKTRNVPLSLVWMFRVWGWFIVLLCSYNVSGQILLWSQPPSSVRFELALKWSLAIYGIVS